MVCSSCRSSCPNCSSPCTKACGVCTCPACTAVCTALVVSNSWNVPACGAEAVLSIPGLTTVLIGSYIYNPTYGRFRITGFNSVTSQITVLNECLPGNAAPGTVVPALTTFIFSDPPSSSSATSISSWFVPACDNTATIETAGLNNVIIGSYLWNPDYGYFKIIGYDSGTGDLTILNECFAENVPPLTAVPAGTSFLFVEARQLSSVLSADAWTIPSCGNSVVINAPGLRGVTVDSYIWNVAWGYFRVTGYNASAGELTVVNDCFSVNQSPAANVPALTPFIFVDGPPNAEEEDGWIDARETWTYNSPTTINVDATATDKYSPGDKIWIDQGGAKYFSIVSVGVNTLEVSGGDDYQVSNASINSPKYSHAESPVGFPPFFNWTPVSIFAVDGTELVTVDSIEQGRFSIVNKNVEFDLIANITLANGGGGADTTELEAQFIFPWLGENSAFCNFPNFWADSGASAIGISRTTPAPGILFFKINGSTFALGAASIAFRGKVPLY